MTRVFCTSTMTPAEASARENSSTARMASKNLPPAAAVLLRGSRCPSARAGRTGGSASDRKTPSRPSRSRADGFCPRRTGGRCREKGFRLRSSEVSGAGAWVCRVVSCIKTPSIAGWAKPVMLALHAQRVVGHIVRCRFLVLSSVMPDYSIGVDMGGTNLRIAAIATDGQLLEKITLGVKLPWDATTSSARCATPSST